MADSTNAKLHIQKNKLSSAAAAGFLSGMLTLINPAKLHPVTRTSLCLGTGAAAGAIVWIGSSQEAEIKDNLKLRSAMVLGLTLAGAASTKLSFVLDEKIHRALARRGFSNPRTAMAIGSGLLTIATFLIDSGSQHPEPTSAQEIPAESQTA